MVLYDMATDPMDRYDIADNILAENDIEALEEKDCLEADSVVIVRSPKNPRNYRKFWFKCNNKTAEVFFAITIYVMAEVSCTSYFGYDSTLEVYRVRNGNVVAYG